MAGIRRMRGPPFAIIATAASLFLAALNASGTGLLGPQGGPGDAAYLPTTQTLVNASQVGGNCGTGSWSDVQYSDDIRCYYSEVDVSPADQLGTIILPDGTDVIGWAASGCSTDTTPWNELDDGPDTHDGDTTCRQGNTNGNRVGVTLANPSWTDAADVDDFTVVSSSVVKRVSTSSAASIAIDVKVGSSSYDSGATQTTTTSFVRYGRTSTTNPISGSEWTSTNINDLKIATRCVDCSPNNRATQMQAKIDAVYNAENALEVRFGWSGIPTSGDHSTLVVECQRLNPGGENFLVQVGQGGNPPSSWMTVYLCSSDGDQTFNTYELSVQELNGGAPLVRVWDAQADTPDDGVRGTLALDVFRIDWSAVTDQVFDQNGNLHEVYSLLTLDPQPNQEVYYQNDFSGNPPTRITASSWDSVQPQIDIQYLQWTVYVVWIEQDLLNGTAFMYSASPNKGTSWSQPIRAIEASWWPAVMSYDMRVNVAYSLDLIWEGSVQAVIDPDVDGDLIRDYVDVVPFSYDAVIPQFAPESASVSERLGVTVAVDTVDNSSASIDIAEAIGIPTLLGSVGGYVQVTIGGGSPFTAPFTAVLKAGYDPATLPGHLRGDYLRFYVWNGFDWMPVVHSRGDVRWHLVWANVTAGGVYTVADASGIDTDRDGIPDAWEPGPAEGKPLTLFEGDSWEPSVYANDTGTTHLAWFDARENQTRVFHKRAEDYGGSWTPDRPLTGSRGDVSGLRIAGAGDRVVVVWEEVVNGTSEVFMLESFDGGYSWGLPYNVTKGSGGGRSPAVEVYDGWTILAYETVPAVGLPGIRLVWFKDTTKRERMLTDAAGSPLRGSTTLVAAEAVVHAFVADDAAGAIWYQRGDIDNVSWSLPVGLTTIQPTSGVRLLDAAENGGRVVLGWTDLREAVEEVYGKLSIDRGISWSPDVRLTPSGIPSRNPSLSFREGFALAWEDLYPSASTIFLQHFRPGLALDADIAPSTELPSAGILDGNYTALQASDDNYETLQEVQHENATVYTSGELTFDGVRNGTHTATWSSDGSYERLNGTSSPFNVTHQWRLDLDDVLSHRLTFKARSLQAGDFDIFYLQGPTRVFMFRVNETSDVTKEYELPPSLVGEVWVQAFRQGNGSDARLDVDSIRVDSVRTPFSYLSHRWVFNITEPGLLTLRAEGHRPPEAGENESYVLSYSSDDISYVHMVELASGSDATYSYDLPPGLTGPLYVRAVDTNHAPGSSVAGSLRLDRMWMSVQGSLLQPLGPPSPMSHSGNTSTLPDVAYDGNGDFPAVVWSEPTDVGTEIYSSDGLGSFYESEAVGSLRALTGLVRGLSDEAFTQDPEVFRSTMERIGTCGVYVLAAYDAEEASRRLSDSFTDLTWERMTPGPDQDNARGSGKDTGESFLGSGEFPQPPRDLTAVVSCTTIQLAWKPPAGGPAVQKYRVYRNSGYGYSRIAEATQETYADTSVSIATQYAYLVTAVKVVVRRELVCPGPPAACYYRITIEEWESEPSNEAGAIVPGYPVVGSTSPTDGASGVEPTIEIVVAFDAAMDQGTVNGVTVSSTPQVSFTFSWISDRQVIMKPGSPLADGTYTITLKGGDQYGGPTIKNGCGLALDGNGDGVPGFEDNYVFSFTVQGPDTRPPTVRTDPDQGASGWDPSQAVSFVFSEAMNEQSVRDGLVYTDGTTTWTGDDGSWQIQDATFHFAPSPALAPFFRYTFTLVGNVVKDLAGNLLDGDGDGNPGGDRTWSFTTAATLQAGQMTEAVRLVWPPPNLPVAQWYLVFRPSGGIQGTTPLNIPSSATEFYVTREFVTDVAGGVTYDYQIRGVAATGEEFRSQWSVGYLVEDLGHSLDVGSLGDMNWHVPGLQLAIGWGSPWQEGAETYRPMSNEAVGKARFHLNLAEPSEEATHMITLRVKGTTWVALYQKAGPNDFQYLGGARLSGGWNSVAFTVNRLWYHDDQTWEGTNLLFEIRGYVWLSSISDVPVALHDEIDENQPVDSISMHTPGISWRSPTRVVCKLSDPTCSAPLGDFWLVAPPPTSEVSIGLAVKLPNDPNNFVASFTLDQWTSATQKVSLGTKSFVANGQEVTVGFQIRSGLLYDWDPSSKALDLRLELVTAGLANGEREVLSIAAVWGLQVLDESAPVFERAAPVHSPRLTLETADWAERTLQLGQWTVAPTVTSPRLYLHAPHTPVPPENIPLVDGLLGPPLPSYRIRVTFAEGWASLQEYRGGSTWRALSYQRDGQVTTYELLPFPTLFSRTGLPFDAEGGSRTDNVDITLRFSMTKFTGMLSVRSISWVADSDVDGLSDDAESDTHHLSAIDPDGDSDGMGDGWEFRHGLDPADPDDAFEDPDSDGIQNVKEYVFAYAGADPQSPDVFIEIDWMDREDLDDPPHIPPAAAKENLIARYRDHGIAVRIDDGTLGYDLDDDSAGGGPFGHRPIWEDGNELQDTRLQENNPDFFSFKRARVFHYGTYVHRLASGASGRAEAPGHRFAIGDAEIQGSGTPEQQVLMHEFGHNVLGVYCNDSGPIDISLSCPGYPGSRYNELLAHFNQLDTGLLNDADEDLIEDQFTHYSEDAMCRIEPCGTVYVTDFSPETWVAVSLWRSFL